MGGYLRVPRPLPHGGVDHVLGGPRVVAKEERPASFEAPQADGERVVLDDAGGEELAGDRQVGPPQPHKPVHFRVGDQARCLANVTSGRREGGKVRSTPLPIIMDPLATVSPLLVESMTSFGASLRGRTTHLHDYCPESPKVFLWPQQ